jgi:uncharacterized protein (PEP-CTERM system associated)
VLLGLLGSNPGLAQIGAPTQTPRQTRAETQTRGPNWSVTRSISAAATVTDNVSLAPDGQKESDLILQLNPRLQVTSTGGRFRLDLDYRAQALAYANTSSSNDINSFLDATARLEAVENRVFVDARGVISQQAISPFGAQPSLTPENANANRAETVTYQLSPYVLGAFGSAADYELRYRITGTRTQGTQVGDSYVEDWLGYLTGRRTYRGLGWTLFANHQVVRPDIGRDITSRRVRGSLIYSINPQIRTTALIGWESNNFSSPTGDDDSDMTYGGILEWTPTLRTRLRGLYEKRPFGDTHEIFAEHRTRLTSWQYTDTKTLTSLPEQLTLGPTTTVFDLFSDALTSRFPDPVARAAEVRRLLLQSGIPADLTVSPLFLTSRATLNRSRQLSVGTLGVRNTVTLTLGVIDTEAADTVSRFVDAFSRFSEVKQRHATASWAVRVTPVSSINLTASHVRTTSSADEDSESKQTALRLLFTHHFGPRTTGTIGLRHTRFDSSVTQDFRENAATASLLVTF